VFTCSFFQAPACSRTRRAACQRVQQGGCDERAQQYQLVDALLAHSVAQAGRPQTLSHSPRPILSALVASFALQALLRAGACGRGPCGALSRALAHQRQLEQRHADEQAVARLPEVGRARVGVHLRPDLRWSVPCQSWPHYERPGGSQGNWQAFFVCRAGHTNVRAPPRAHATHSESLHESLYNWTRRAARHSDGPISTGQVRSTTWQGPVRADRQTQGSPLSDHRLGCMRFKSCNGMRALGRAPIRAARLIHARQRVHDHRAGRQSAHGGTVDDVLAARALVVLRAVLRRRAHALSPEGARAKACAASTATAASN